MTRRCSHCSNNGHNSRTCISKGNSSCGAVSGGVAGGSGAGGGGDGGVKIFGVRLTENSIIKKSASMGNLSHYHSSSSAAASPNPGSPSADPLPDQVHVRDGYLSDDPAHAACSTNRRSDRKKGVPWTEEEHRKFLIGLQKLGKGDWRGIARHFVGSRTPTQVASHAQKHFIRQSNASRRKRRSSLFDMVSDKASDPQSFSEEQFLATTFETDEHNEPIPPLDPSLTYDFEPMDASSQETLKEDEEQQRQQQTTLIPAFFPAYIPIPIQMWPSRVSHEVVKPIAVVPKEAANVDEVVGLSELSLGEIENDLSLKLRGSSRPSAFHVNTGAVGNGSDVNDKGNAIRAV